MAEIPDFLSEFQKERDWAKENGEVSQRTVARYRDLGLPFLEWGGCIWIHRRGGREFLNNRVRRRNPRRRQRQAAAATPTEITT
jgi:hypothetical protein